MAIHLPNPTDKLRIFKGPPDSPFLAPRGVFLVGSKLLVSDTGHNRVFIWNNVPKEEYEKPDVVLGQSEIESTGRNRGGEVNTSTLQYPSGLWSDGEKVMVADAWNHRVLIWHTFPVISGQPAEVVIGQTDFSVNQPNELGVGATPSERSLYWPYGLSSDGKHLWIADTGNRRVLFYDKIPTTNHSAADRLIGKSSFSERDYDHQHAIWPYSVKLGPKGELAITDTQYYRVLLWDHWRDAFKQSAKEIIGQSDFQANGQNQFQYTPQANTLNWCYDSCFDQKGFWVVDTGNSRVLKFDQFPKKSNHPADAVIGPADFTTGSENLETIHGTGNALYWPFSLAIQDEVMVIADTGNHRLIFIDQ
ncbi:MAG: hypothetical protein ACFB15_14950 [Cyclobacteriaceae bacterium]